MMVPRSLAALVVAATASLAATPAGFEPASTTDLYVLFNGTAALNGQAMPRLSTTTQPMLGTTTRLNGSSYAVLMIDIDIPTNTPPETNTLLHWMQTGLTPATTATNIMTSGGRAIQLFLLENRTQTEPVVTYFGPNPPARTPLSHRYTQILVDTSGVTAQSINGLQSAAGTRPAIGFNASAVLEDANLANKVVAGNFFNVTNPGPVMGVATNTTGTTGNNNTVTAGAARAGTYGTVALGAVAISALFL
ncbi:phosphatidylethanolamine-binding protein [Apodospora peruviana]|uniref:Phosphatidylethanolamine-binding protein n=1 Tax=Apodospora peruviana TaxID=516989 RepID=A0AAE0IJW7_9PEZI|nr:phosphatidylethanolamine-binding protein [Apodospora peruviana]